MFLSDFHNDVRIHLYESAVRVVGESGIVRLFREALHDYVVETEI
ncbi:hypothetical protein SDC9_128545 [bioreactor metagenome]|uniref:Uncharacterized protein n=1 Tax=bioreactor metagenome TaxID=1076179 RepID=A0A645CXR7_9ZZZZ